MSKFPLDNFQLKKLINEMQPNRVINLHNTAVIEFYWKIKKIKRVAGQKKNDKRPTGTVTVRPTNHSPRDDRVSKRTTKMLLG